MNLRAVVGRSLWSSGRRRFCGFRCASSDRLCGRRAVSVALDRLVCGSPDVSLAVCGSPRLWISEVPSAVSVDLDLRSHRSLWISEAPHPLAVSLETQSKGQRQDRDEGTLSQIKCFDNDKVRSALIAGLMSNEDAQKWIDIAWDITSLVRCRGRDQVL